MSVGYLSTHTNLSNLSRLTIKSPSDSAFPVRITSIACKKQCFSRSNHTLFIVVDYVHLPTPPIGHLEDIVLLQFNLDTESFIDLTSYQHLFPDAHALRPTSQFFKGCVASDRHDRFVLSFGTVWSDPAALQRIGLRYGTLSDEWNILQPVPPDSFPQHSMGCALDADGAHIFLFGGNGSTAIQRYDVSSDELSVLPDQTLAIDINVPSSNLQIRARSGIILSSSPPTRRMCSCNCSTPTRKPCYAAMPQRCTISCSTSPLRSSVARSSDVILDDDVSGSPAEN